MITVFEIVGDAWLSRDSQVIPLSLGTAVVEGDTIWLDDSLVLGVGGVPAVWIHKCGDAAEVKAEPDYDQAASATRMIGAGDWWEGHFGRQVVIRDGPADAEIRVLSFTPAPGVVPPRRPPGICLEERPETLPGS